MKDIQFFLLGKDREGKSDKASLRVKFQGGLQAEAFSAGRRHVHLGSRG